ncbi:hypothetical protein SBRCBS47491_009063 [Sporothrix bragantina]|uniref:USP domain-containing protein n=1 Tax=Sporothrix bragantina TaxID=671064 RepID=A0ABP0CRP2_9PEZI
MAGGGNDGGNAPQNQQPNPPASKPASATPANPSGNAGGNPAPAASLPPGQLPLPAPPPPRALPAANSGRSLDPPAAALQQARANLQANSQRNIPLPPISLTSRSTTTAGQSAAAQATGSVQPPPVAQPATAAQPPAAQAPATQPPTLTQPQPPVATQPAATQPPATTADGSTTAAAAGGTAPAAGSSATPSATPTTAAVATAGDGGDGGDGSTGAGNGGTSTQAQQAQPQRQRQNSPPRRVAEAYQIAIFQELERSAKEDQEDLWQENICIAEAQNFPPHEIEDLKQLRKDYETTRKHNLLIDAAAARWYFKQHNVPIKEPAGQDGGDGGDGSITLVSPHPDFQLPSAGPAFDPPIRPLAEFLVEVRKDMISPMRNPSLLPRGLHNPGNLCYRNAVVSALLNTPRLLSFLHTHSRRTRTYMGTQDVNHHLLTRLYHLALAYWERGGLHPMSPKKPENDGGDGNSRNRKRDDKEETYEKLMTIFWRACKYNLAGSEVDQAALDALAELQSGPCRDDDGAANGHERPKHDFETRNWKQVCSEGALLAGGATPAAGRASPVKDLCHRQQDAVQFYEWLVEMAATQLHCAPQRYMAAKATDYYDCMFRTYITTRYLCTRCHRPVRLRRQAVERETSIKLNVALHPSQAGASIAAVKKSPSRYGNFEALLHAYFNDNIEGGKTCDRCKAKSDPLRRARRMQTAPEVLPINLVRTGYDPATNHIYKTSNIVDAAEFIDVSPFLEPHIFMPGTRILYRLAAVVSHAGDSPQSGHYVSYVRHDPDEKRQGSAAIHDYEDARRVMREARARRGLVGSESLRIAKDMRSQRVQLGSHAPPASASSDRFWAIERHDSHWARVNDSQVETSIPFTRIMNTTHDQTWQPTSRNWFDPVLLVYEKWVEKHVVDKRTGLRAFQVPMNMPGGSSNSVAPARGSARTRADHANPSVDESLWRANATADVRVPEKWPPRVVVGNPRGVFAHNRGDDGVGGRMMYVHPNGLDKEEDSDSDEDADGGNNGGRAAVRKAMATRVETFFGWGAYDRAVEAEKKAAEAAKAAQTAAPTGGGTARGTGVASGATGANGATGATGAAAGSAPPLQGGYQDGTARPSKRQRQRWRGWW